MILLKNEFLKMGKFDKSNLIHKKLNEIGLNQQITEELISYFDRVSFNKNQIIQDSNKTGKYLYFLEKGIIRHYYSKNNKEFTSWFSKEGDFVANAGFFKQKPVKEIIVAIEDVEVFALSYKDFNKFCIKSYELEAFIRDYLVEQLFLLEQYIADTFLLSATERYNNFLKQFPELVLRVPLIYIASFLSMTPETLSRVRATK